MRPSITRVSVNCQKIEGNSVLIHLLTAFLLVDPDLVVTQFRVSSLPNKTASTRPLLKFNKLTKSPLLFIREIYKMGGQLYARKNIVLCSI